MKSSAFPCKVTLWRGTGGGGAGALGEKGVGGVQEVGVEGAGSKRKGENYTTLCNILQLKKYKEVGDSKNRVGTQIEGYRKRKF